MEQGLPLAWIHFVAALQRKEHEPILQKILHLRAQGQRIFPPQEEIFSALSHTLPSNVRVIILGQDPYHGSVHGYPQAHGLAFSVRETMPAPPSLRNIFKEIQSDIYRDVAMPHTSPCLLRWADQGVLLLNTVFSVQEGMPQSHAKMGWQAISSAILGALAQQREGLAVLLWGKPAQKYAHLFAPKAGEAAKHMVLTAAHPSPLAASRGFFGCKHFSKVNAWLLQQGEEPICW